ncbi:APC family permease [Nocardioides sp. NPDC023903]|uniref:APC family permease n=1 Tax=Nocardioides sp. NPDC023903 TaxID=3157195 RepID=UPI0033D29A3F
MPTTPTPQEGALKSGVLTAGGIALIVVAAAAPLALIAGYGPIGFLVGGIGAPAGFIVAGAVLALFMTGILVMTRHVDRPGAFYAYIARGLGPSAGTGAASVAIVAYLTVNIGGMGILSVTTQNLVQLAFGVEVPWWVIGLILTGATWYVCRRGIDVGVKLLVVILAAEMGILLVIAVAILLQPAPTGHSFAAFEPANIFTPGMAAASLVWFGAYFGIESTTLYRSETRNPERTVPRATVISLAFLALFYCFFAWALAQAFTVPALADAIAAEPAAMLYTIADHYVGPWAGLAAQALLVTSSLGSGIAYYNAVSRYAHSMGTDRMLPRATTRVHPRYRSPSFGNVQAIIMTVAVLAFGLLGLDPYLQLTVWFSSPGSLGIMLLMALASLAVVAYFIRHRTARRSTRVTVLITAVLSFILLVAVVYEMIANIELLTGGGLALNIAVVATPVLIFLVVATASAVRRRLKRQPAALPASAAEGA